MSSELYAIQNIETKNYIVRGDSPGDIVRTGNDNRAIFRIELISELLYSITDVTTRLPAVPSPDRRVVVWGERPAPWVIRPSGVRPGPVRIDNWSEVDQTVVLEGGGPGDWELIPVNE